MASADSAVRRYLTPTRSGHGFSGWWAPKRGWANSGFRRDPLVVPIKWVAADRALPGGAPRHRRDAPVLLLVASFVNPHDIVLFCMGGAAQALPH